MEKMLPTEKKTRDFLKALVLSMKIPKKIADTTPLRIVVMPTVEIYLTERPKGVNKGLIIFPNAK